MKEIKTISLGNKLNLTLIPETKFKTNVVSIYIQRNLSRQETTKNALLPSIITSGCEKYNSVRQMSMELENLYGSSIMGGVSKRGERQVISFKMVSTDERYLDEKIFGSVIEFFNEIINNPLIINNGFKKEYVDIEKANLRTRILSIINDKGSYAVEKAFENMCEDESYSISEYGYEEDLDEITPTELYDHYRHILKSSPIDIVIEGNFNQEEVTKIIYEKFKFERENIIDIPRAKYIKNIKEVKEIEERMDITQGKLVMGYRANIDYRAEKDYYALVVGSNILGGGPSSKMFLNIREKESLCYYIYSSVEKYKSILFIAAGIEFENYDKTIKLVKEQLENIKIGNISNEELENSKIALTNAMKSLGDNIGAMSDFYFAQNISETYSTVEEIIEWIKNIRVEDIVNAFSNIQLDTIYFLRN